ncbi:MULTISPECIES: hypothetical protein [Pseudomonas]|uniref:hypothetical protein n=1 Tax=Pseudomonas TaxID=286 RepID=UPI000B148285|nr:MULTISPECIES: hypothetical protein [Pseudomonas]WHS56958.1 hypothetical protein QLH64_13535 [Pseudomonas brassicacearum]
MAAPSAFLYPIIHEFKKAECVPSTRIIVQAFDLKEFAEENDCLPEALDRTPVLPNSSVVALYVCRMTLR